MKTIFCYILLSLFTLFGLHAQIFEYIGTDNGLSSRRVLSIRQDKQGYMWILTHKGVDRYNGKEFTHYPLLKDGTSINLYPNLNYLRTDDEFTIWEMGKDGYIFRYDELKDTFQLMFDLGEVYPEVKQTPVNCVYMDRNNHFWFCTQGTIYIYDGKSQTHYKFPACSMGMITSITQGEDNRFYLSSHKGLFAATLDNYQLRNITKIELGFSHFIDYIYYHNRSKKLIINTLLNNLFLYDCQTKEIMDMGGTLTDIGVNAIIPNNLNPDEVFIATDGDGVYKLNTRNNHLVHFLKEDTHSLNKMNGSIIKDIYMDSANRIWNVIYPIGITIYSERYPAYQWLTHSPNNHNSLVNNRINGIIEDSDGDLWYATSNGVSHYNIRTKQWNNYFAATKTDPATKSSIFIALCESHPGFILAGGYMSGIYMINKKTKETKFFQQKHPSKEGPDKYIRAIFKDSEGLIWSGGFYRLKAYDPKTQTTTEYNIGYPITDIAQKDSTSLWVGTINGIYIFHKKDSRIEPFETEVGSINMIYAPQGESKTYFGAYGNGLFVFDKESGKTTHYHTDNCELISNNIYSIVHDKNNNLYLGTENGLSFFNLKENHFTNWTKEQGLMASNFNSKAVVHTHDNQLIFGSNEGVIIIPDSIKLPRDFSCRMIFSNLSIMYHNVLPGEKGSPLTKRLDETSSIELDYDQNSFLLNVSAINFDSPSNILYSWKLDGFYNQWNRPSEIGIIRYTNLSPGTYTLRVRAILKENHQILEERSLVVTVDTPFWFSFGAFLIYAGLLIGMTYALLRYQMIRKDRKVSKEKINFFMHTAHDIRTPLTLIKAPLGEIMKNEQLSEQGMKNLNLAMQNTDNLSELANNLMNFQKEELYSSNVNVTKQELNAYLEKYLLQFKNYAVQKGIEMEYQSNFDQLEVWIDCNKINSILRNLLSNALKYTPKGGSVKVQTSHTKTRWHIVITDTGIGIPKEDQKKLFKFLFRGKNATNQLIIGSGVGMLLTYQLIKKHMGKITFDSTENIGTSFHLSFPIHSKHYQYNEEKNTDQALKASVLIQDNWELPNYPRQPETQEQADENAPLILIVEDNDNLRSFLKQSLQNQYRIAEAENGQEGIAKVKEQQPDLIISDIMMPLMNGKEMCRILKNDIETSHIPIILLTALGERTEILKGLESKADMYIVKPFDLMVLKANISNILENRELIRKRFQQVVPPSEKEEPQELSMLSNLDDEFMMKVTQLVKEGLGKELNVDILCSGMHMSRTSFYNKIKVLTGMAPADFIRKIKMQEAATLLKSKRYSVSEVSDMMGFADPKYFTDTFKKFYGVPPSVYMKQQPSDTAETGSQA